MIAQTLTDTVSAYNIIITRYQNLLLHSHSYENWQNKNKKNCKNKQQNCKWIEVMVVYCLNFYLQESKFVSTKFASASQPRLTEYKFILKLAFFSLTKIFSFYWRKVSFQKFSFYWSTSLLFTLLLLFNVCCKWEFR